MSIPSFIDDMKQEFQTRKDKINEISEEKYTDEIDNILEELYELIGVVMIYFMEEKEIYIRQELMKLQTNIYMYIEAHTPIEKSNK
ncbi:hypothetical protein IIU_05921 [Bacillus cereus VD133]|uniref:Uncharacterized protein n=1 Tax=Bacillus cereus VD133 TaxID=1053233 RepID=A0A9W5PL69_BACCE|nr:hypothetical protein [Bacillus cereus]EOO27167.1 hypothetical protein IIU_05921 [Bacillus cereus VD133]